MEVKVLENGIVKGAFGTYQVGDVFKVERVGSTIVYKKNDVIFYTSVAQLVISNLTIASGKAYEVIQNGLSNGALVYTDRSFTYSSVPVLVEGATYIKTANDDKNSSGNSFLTFDVNQDVTVYVAHDDRITTKPSWMVSFTDTGDDLVTTDATFSLFSKDYAAGTIILGGNESGGNSMYTVVLVGQGTGSSAIPTDLPLKVDCAIYNDGGEISDVKLIDMAGIGGGPSDTTPPSTPDNLQATAISTSQIDLSWDASTDDVGVTGYMIYRDGTQIDTTASSTYQDTGLSASTSYMYTVSAIDGAGNESYQSLSASATTGF